MSIEDFESLPDEDAVGMTPAKPGPVNVLLAVLATVLAATFAAVLVVAAA
jgi:hypothetical protein